MYLQFCFGFVSPQNSIPLERNLNKITCDTSSYRGLQFFRGRRSLRSHSPAPPVGWGNSAGCREAEAAARPTPSASVQGRAKAEKEGEEREGLTVESKLARSAFLAKNQRRGLSALRPTEQGQTTLTFCARARRCAEAAKAVVSSEGRGCIEASRDGKEGASLSLLKGQDRRWRWPQ